MGLIFGTNITKMNKLISNIKLGSDPELFLVDSATKGFKSAIGLIGGTKENPRPLEKPGFFVQEDNVLIEFNIPPSVTAKDFVENINSGIAQITKLIGNQFKVVAQASAFMPYEELTMPEANIFGCNPDNNAWNEGNYNAPPDIPVNGLRSAGAHIHIGYDFEPAIFKKEGFDKNFMDMELIKLCDLYLGIPSVVMDKDVERKKLYGKAGAYRHKDYGVEYRVLSSFWLNSSRRIKWAFDQTMRAVEEADNQNFINKALGKKIEQIINTSNVNAAKELIKEFDLTLA